MLAIFASTPKTPPNHTPALQSEWLLRCHHGISKATKGIIAERSWTSFWHRRLSWRCLWVQNVPDVFTPPPPQKKKKKSGKKVKAKRWSCSFLRFLGFSFLFGPSRIAPSTCLHRRDPDSHLLAAVGLRSACYGGIYRPSGLEKKGTFRV